MSMLRAPAKSATKALTASKNLCATTSSTTRSSSSSRPLSTTAVRSGGGHAPHYDQPGGWLWGVPPGSKPKKESWENMMIYGYCGSILLAGIAYVYKPDTSIQTWALEEARRRLEKEGILEDPSPDHVEED